jgi:hypothetical protein
MKNRKSSTQCFNHLAIVMLLLCSSQVYAFDYVFTLTDNAFHKAKYRFSIARVIDARVNDTVPIGFIPGFSGRPQSIGNDSLTFDLADFFQNDKDHFDTLNNIVLVVNQINFTIDQAQNVEMLLSLDYYLVRDNKHSLLYKQYCRHIKNVKTVMVRSNAVNIAFTKAMEAAFDDFSQQLEAGNSSVVYEMDATALTTSVASTPTPVISNQNLKDGMYFSCRDLYLNKPGLTSGYTLPDTNMLGTEQVSTRNEKTSFAPFACVINKKIFINTGNDYYRQALLSDSGKVYFHNVNRYSVSTGASAGGAVAGGVLGSFGIVGAVLGGAAQAGITKAGTKTHTGDLFLDFETGRLVWSENKPVDEEPEKNGGEK